MASIWSLGAIGIYVDKHDGGQDPVWGELHVLDAMNVTRHYSGSTGNKVSISGTLYTSGSGSPELNTLKEYTESSDSRALTSDNGSLGSFKVLKLSYERKQALNETYPVYRVNIELGEA